MLQPEVTAADLPKLKRIDELRETMSKLQYLTDHRSEKVVYLSRFWTYEDLVCLAHEYYSLARHYNGFNLKNFVTWLSQEKSILAKHKLVWPVH